MADLVCTKVGKLDAESVAACKGFLRARHEMIVDSYLWKDTVSPDFEVDVAAGATHAILPAEAGRPMAVWDKISGLPIPVGSLTNIVVVNPSALADVGGLMTFVEVESVGWAYPLAEAGSQLAFINTGPAEITISISGERNLNFVSLPTLPDITNTQALTIATGGTNTSVAWKVIHRMQKPAGADVLIAQLGTFPEKAWAWPADSTETSFARIRLVNPPQTATTLGILAKRRLRQMNLDSDGPMVRGIENALLAFAQADMLERSRQYAKASAKISEGTSLLEGARDLERNQSAKESRITPEVPAEEAEHWNQW